MTKKTLQRIKNHFNAKNFGSAIVATAAVGALPAHAAYDPADSLAAIAAGALVITAVYGGKHLYAAAIFIGRSIMGAIR